MANATIPELIRDDLSDADIIQQCVRSMSQGIHRLPGGPNFTASTPNGFAIFRHDERNINDEQNLKLWMRFADLTGDANEVFLFLRSNAIGTHLALLWTAWAYVLEMADSYTNAMEILAEGIARGARPLSLLREFQGTFYARMRTRIRVARSRGGQYSIEGHDYAGSGDEAKPVWPHKTVGTTLDADVFESPSIFSDSLKASCFDPWLSKGEYCSAKDSRKTSAGRNIEWCSTRTHMQVNHDPSQPQCRHKGQQGKFEPITPGDECTGVNVAAETAKGSTEGTRVRYALHGNAPDVQTVMRGIIRRGECNANQSPSDVVHEDRGTTSAFLIRDPYARETRKRLTVETTEYIEWARSSKIVHNVRHECLTRRWPREMVKIKAGSRRRKILPRTLGSRRVDVVGELGTGAHATVYSCRYDEDHRDVAVKIERQDTEQSLPWECFITIQLHERLSRGGIEELGVNDRQQKRPIQVMVPDGLFSYGDGCAMSMPQGRLGTLHDMVTHYARSSESTPQLVAMHYAVEMLRFCRAMHAVSILHMDIKPDNWLLIHHPQSMEGPQGVARSLSLIDFGRAIDLSVLPYNGSGVVFTGKQACAPGFSCPSTSEGRRWKHDADLFGVACCIYFMLHGVYLEVVSHPGDDLSLDPPARRWRPARKCRRFWETDLWDNLFDQLLNVDCEATGTLATTVILAQIEQSLSSHLDNCHRRRDLAELLRRQDNILHCR